MEKTQFTLRDLVEATGRPPWQVKTLLGRARVTHAGVIGGAFWYTAQDVERVVEASRASELVAHASPRSGIEVRG